MKYQAILVLFLIQFIFPIEKIHAINYQNYGRLNLSTNVANNNIILYGDWNHSLNTDNNHININFVIEEPEYIYNLNKKSSNIDFTTQLYDEYVLKKNETKHSFYFGFMPTLSSESSINKIMGNSNYYFGVKSLSKLKNSDENFYVLTNTYLNNNSALVAAYQIEPIEDILYLNLTYTPNMNVSIKNYQTKNITSNDSVLDGSAIIYNETMDVGYGLVASARSYLDSNSYDISSGIMLDYLGFKFKTGYLYGNNEIFNSQDSNYQALSTELYYSIFAFTFGVHMLNSRINTDLESYDTKLKELNIIYKISKNINVNTGVFYEDIKLNFTQNTGVLIGVGVNI
jgi:hypothetical protein